MKKIIFFLLIALPFTFSSANAQTDTVKKKIDKARFNELFTEANQIMIEAQEQKLSGFNDTALKIFLLLHSVQPNNANINFKIGQLYLESVSEKAKAVEFLERALPFVSRKYVPDEATEKKCPELVYYLLGQAYHITYRFDEAIAMFEKFKKAVNQKDLPRMKEIVRKIEISKTAKMLTGSPIQCTITNLGDSVNSEYPDYGAVITADESAVYFTSRRYNVLTGGNNNRTVDDKYYEDIWISERKEDGTWSEAKSVSNHINSWYNEAIVGISADGQQLFIYKDDQNGSIYYSRFESDDWSYAYKLGSEPHDITDINSPAWEPSATLSPDGNTLYFVSDRPGGFGGRDIYKCVKLPTGRWSKATNLGPTINTAYDEDAPFMHPDGMTMFFSSNGHNTMGGFDIFFTVKSDSGWYPPQNMGYPINTTDDDIFYVMSTDGKRAYFSSVRPEGLGDKDIYVITIPQRVVIPVTLLKGYISFTGIKDTLLSYVTITAADMETGSIVQEVHPNPRTLKYILPLNPGRTGKTYIVKYEAEGYRPFTEIISVSPEGEYKEVDKNFDFKPLGTITLFGKVSTRSGEGIASVKISVKDAASKKELGIFSTTENGTYSFDLEGKGGEHYLITYETDGYLTMNETLELPPSLSEYDFKRDVVMETSKMLGTIAMSGKITDAQKKPIAGARIVIKDNKTGNTIATHPVLSSGNYYFNLQRGKNYNISFEADEYLFQSENINVPKEKIYSEIKKDIVLEKIQKGSKIILNNIFFDSGKSALRKESYVELNKLVEIMKQSEKIKVEIGGHTDNKGKEQANMKLSLNRANAVAKYLILKGIDRTQIITEGYGPMQPIAPNTLNGKPNPKGMQLNRRVEFKILDS